MNMFALVLTVAVVFQQGAMDKWPHDFAPGERTDNTDYLGSLPPDLSEVVLGEVSEPNAEDQSSLCYLVREGQAEEHVVCQQQGRRRRRLFRRNFNVNPFGLRFGKRSWTEPPQAESAGPGSRKLLPYPGYLRDAGLPV
uniref:Uncharacterized protein n=1 Tax=Scleropages formosus TaxID=113540 RepID=A0A8C9R2H0_SCLFO